jgi:hypothetical protein
MKKLNITPGKWFLPVNHTYYEPGSTASGKGDWNTYVNSDVGTEYCPARGSGPDGLTAQDNAALIADAGNTYNATQMLPSQMAERIRVLEHKLEVFDQLEAYGCTSAKIWLDSVERIKALEDGLRNLVSSWDKNTHRPEIFKTARMVDGSTFSYWSPAAAMVDSEHIAHARALLAPPIDEAHGHLLSNPE